MEVESAARTGFTGFASEEPDTKSDEKARGAAEASSSSSPPPPQPAASAPTSPPDSSSPESSKNNNGNSKAELPEEFVPQAPAAPAERMTEMPEGEEGWRAYYEHPLTAATTAMLNINGGGAEDQTSGMGLLYEYYKLPPLDKMDKALVDKYGSLPAEIWSTAVTSAVANTVVPSAGHLRVLPAIGTPKAVSVAASTQQQQSPATTLVTTTAAAGRTSQSVSPEPPAVIPQQDVELFLNRAAGLSKAESEQLLAANGAVSPNGKPVEGLSSPERSRPGSAKSTISSTGLSSNDIPVIVSSPSTVVVHVKQEPIEPPSTPGVAELQAADALHQHLRESSPHAVDIALPSPVPVSAATPVSLPEALKGREMQGSPPQSATTVISLGPASPYPTQLFANLTAVQPTYDGVGLTQYGVVTSPSLTGVANNGQSPQYGVIGGSTQTTSSARSTASSVYTLSTGDYYREYYSSPATPTDQYQTVRQHLATYSDTADSAAFLDRYIRQTNNYKGAAATNLHGLTVDLPSPDSGIGEATITPRENGTLPQIFDYSELSQTQNILQSEQKSNGPTTPGSRSSSSQSNRRSWHDYGRNSDSDKVQIPKIHSDVGFRYFLESPISTSQRKEDDRITYINKGQFYGITLEYVPDPDKPLKHSTVKSIVMLVFREEKSMEDEMKAWQFWHSRQHSVKQRILDADTKNSSGIVGQIEEITHNAIAFYWNPLESPAKINIAVQCLSTDFSNQKGVKGLPLHLQIDTFDDGREGCSPVHRGYCQIKVFCDKGAERKTRDEERRAAKRKLTATGSGRKKIEEMYHPPCERSEFYSMSDLLKPPILFTPSEDLDKITTVELNFYNNHSPSIQADESVLQERQDGKTVDPSANSDLTFTHPPAKRQKVYPTDRVMLYARRENEDVYQALHLVPPTLAGLANAIETKYHISTKHIRNLLKRSKKGITVQMDDDIIKHYCNEDLFLVEILKVDEECYDITLVEL